MQSHQIDELISRAQRNSKSRRYDEALADYRNTLKFSPEHIQVFINLGNHYCQKDDLPSAIECFLFVARLLTRSGLYSLAAAICSYALKFDDLCADIRSAMHDLHEKMGMTCISHQDILDWRAEVRQLERKGRFAEAIQTSELLFKKAPLPPEVLIKLTGLCMKIGDRDRGNTYFRQATYQLMKRKMNPRNKELLAQLGASNPYCHVTPGELIMNLEQWVMVITNFLVAYFPDQDPWESEREMGTRYAQDFREEYIGRAERYLARGLTPLEVFRKIKERLAEHEKDYYRYLRRQLSESRQQEVN